MFGFGKRKNKDEGEPRAGVLKRLKSKLSRSRKNLGGRLTDLLLARNTIDADLLEELETLLITADVGVGRPPPAWWTTSPTK
jgi:fused signal recognition particle receptor